MSVHPPTTVKVTAIEPCGETKVRIIMEMVVDVHRLAEVGTDLLRAVSAKLSKDKLSKDKRKS